MANIAPAVRKALKAAKVDVATKQAGWGAVVKGNTLSGTALIEFRTMGETGTARKALAALEAAGYKVQAFGYGGRFLRDLSDETVVIKSLYVKAGA